MTLEKLSGGVRRTFSHWTGVTILALTSASLALTIAENNLDRLSDNENLDQEQRFLDVFRDNVSDITKWQKRLVSLKQKVEKKSEQAQRLQKLGDLLVETKTDNMIANVLLNKDLPEKTYQKIRNEIETKNIQTYSLNLEGTASYFLREGQNSVFNDVSLSGLSRLEKAQKIKKDVVIKSGLASFAIIIILAGSLLAGAKLSPLVASAGHESEKYLKKKRMKRQLSKN